MMIAGGMNFTRLRPSDSMNKRVDFCAVCMGVVLVRKNRPAVFCKWILTKNR